jgi:hypothetical protein
MPSVSEKSQNLGPGRAGGRALDRPAQPTDDEADLRRRVVVNGCLTIDNSAMIIKIFRDGVDGVVL